MSARQHDRGGRPPRGLYSKAIAGLPRRNDTVIKHQTKGRVRSVFERLDHVPEGLRDGNARRRDSYPYNTGRMIRMSDDDDNWKHDRFDEDGNSVASSLFIRGLTKDVVDGRLAAVFENIGCHVTMLKIERAPLTTAVVGFARRDSAAKAFDALHNTMFMGNRIRLMIWQRDEESAARKALEARREQDRIENEEIRKELLAMQQQPKDNTPERHVTMTHMETKRSVFERVS